MVLGLESFATSLVTGSGSSVRLSGNSQTLEPSLLDVGPACVSPASSGLV